MAKHRGVEPSEEHECTRNWHGSSTAMEADIIADGKTLPYSSFFNLHDIMSVAELGIFGPVAAVVMGPPLQAKMGAKGGGHPAGHPSSPPPLVTLLHYVHIHKLNSYFRLLCISVK